MIDMDFDPVQLQLSTHTINFLPDIYDKQVKIAELLNISMLDSVQKSMAGILSRNDFFFHGIFTKAEFNYSLNITEFKTEYRKILAYIFDGIEVTYTMDYLEIEGQKFPHDGNYHEMFTLQNSLIEYVGLAYTCNQIKKVDGISRDFRPEKENFTVEEAAHFMKYKKSYVYKLKHLGHIKGYQPSPGGKLFFKRGDLKAFLYKTSSTTIEEMV